MNSGITLLTFTVFVAVFLWIGAIAAQVSRNTEADYLLGSRSFGKLFIGLSMGATANSGWLMLGAVGLAYAKGLSAFMMVIPILIGELIFWRFFPDKLNRLSVEQDAQTIPEFLGTAIPKPAGKRSITFLVAIITIIFVGAYTVAQFLAAAKTLNAFFEIDTNYGVIIAAISILIYCVTGGLRASIWTDVVQSFVVMAVCFGVLPFAIIGGGGFSEIWSALTAINPDLTNFTAGYNAFTLTTFVIGFIGFGFCFSMSNPQSLVRLLAGKSPEEAKRAGWIYVAYTYSTWIAMMAFGMVCRAVIPGLDDPELALPSYAIANFPPVLIGIVLAGVFSTVASTADSQVLVCSSALGRELFPRWSRKMSKKYGVKYEQGVTLVFGLVTMVATLFASSPRVESTVFTLVFFAVGAMGGSIGPAMFIILLQRRTNTLALGGSMVAGLTTTIVWGLLAYNNILNEMLPGFIVALVVHEGLMLLSKKSRKIVN